MYMPVKFWLVNGVMICGNSNISATDFLFEKDPAWPRLAGIEFLLFGAMLGLLLMSVDPIAF